MKRVFTIALLTFATAGVPLLAGCDDQASKSTETKTTSPDGTTTVDKNKTTTDANGNTSTSSEHHTTP